MIKDQLDLGRPEKLQILFGRRCLRRRGRVFRTRVFCPGVELTLHVSHRHPAIKQYWTHDCVLRTETTFQEAHEFGIGRRLLDLGQLIPVGRAINRGLLELERQANRPTSTVASFEALVLPSRAEDQPVPGFRFGHPRVVALFGALSHFCWVSDGFRSKDLRPLVGHHLAGPYGKPQMAHDLRRLRRKQLIAPVPKTFRYHLTALGWRLILFCTKLYSRALCRGLG